MNNEMVDDCNWITTKFLTDILHKSGNNKNLILESYTIKNATEKGENYLSAMYCIKLKYKFIDNENNHEINEKSLIIKKSLTDPLLVNENLIEFQRESSVYEKILPECEKLLNKFDYNVIFAPKFISIYDKLLVLEDLSLNNYKINDRKKRLDFIHCKLVLEKIAKFHAVTACLYKLRPELFKYHMTGNMTTTETPWHIFYKNSMDSCLNFVKTIPDLNEYIEKLNQFKNHVVEKQIEIYTRNDNEFNCLNHGDLWVNNIMYKKNDDGDIVDILLIDYQEGYFGSPGIDLNNFIYTSCNDNVQTYHLDELIEYYHSILKQTLEKLEFTNQIPTLKNIKEAIKTKSNHALTSTLCVSPVLLIEKTEYADAVHFISNDEHSIQVRNEVYSNPAYEKLLKRLLPKFVKEEIL